MNFRSQVARPGTECLKYVIHSLQDMMAASGITPGPASSHGSGMQFANTDIYSAFSKEYSLADMSARFSSINPDWSMYSARDTPRTSGCHMTFLLKYKIFNATCIVL